ncbi:MAG: hypothetical protein QM500_02755 [Methylococcales bacterium]
MLKTVLRKEHKNRWEKRTCLTPEAVAELAIKGYVIDVEESEVRIFSDDKYLQLGCKLVSTPDQHQFILGIKEPPVGSIQSNQVHLAFSHTHKGQAYNMPLLQKIIDKDATLLDYELITDEAGLRTIAFGRYAGIAGAVDTFGLAGTKLEMQGIKSSLQLVQQSWKYQQEAAVKEALEAIDVSKNHPVRVVVVGSGKVGQGSIEVCQWLGLEQLSSKAFIDGDLPQGSFYTVLSSRHLYQKLNSENSSVDDFDFADFVEHGKDLYHSVFYKFLGQFDILLYTPYWEEKYPALLPLEIMQKYSKKLPMMIGDITCDIEGSLVCTKKNTDTDSPALTYYPETDSYVDGVKADGVSVMAIDNLPCELSMDASSHFSSILPQYVAMIMEMNLSETWQQSQLPEIMKRAVIVYNGKLTPNFEYLNEFLD